MCLTCCNPYDLPGDGLALYGQWLWCHFNVNSLPPRKFEWNFRYLIFQIISVIDGRVISCELALWWMSLDLTDEKTTLVQVMAWCHQATRHQALSHYLSQCWPRSLWPYGVTRPQSVNSLWPGDAIGQHRSGSTFVQVMACWLKAPSHYLNQYCHHQWGLVPFTWGQS